MFIRDKIFSIDDKFRDLYELPNDISSNLLSVLKTFEITHLFISTEPKAHNMYLKFALENNINVLSDKPITVVKNMTSLSSINKVRKQYYDLLKLAERSKADCKIMCQRQYHKGYEYVKELLNSIVSKYQVPITYIDIYHCDGNWEMMHDLNKENHPYKYGYGKLFHSGYHFIDLLSDLLKINDQLPSNKKIKYGYVYSSCFTPNDEKAVFNKEDYKRLFKNQNIPKYYVEKSNPNFNKFGEKNFYGLMKFLNRNNQLITEVNLNLLHYGFSRRGWIETKNFYKENGRIRHERLNIQVGPLFNIQIHSYQSKEIKDRLDLKTEEQIGGLEHFEIHIYRNVDLIGGKPFEKINLGDLYTDKEKKNILGYNELSREDFLNNFLKGKCEKGDIKDQALAIEILYSCALGLHNYYKKIEKTEKIHLENYFNHYGNINLKEIKKYTFIPYQNLESNVINQFEICKNNYTFGVTFSKIPQKKLYSTYVYMQNTKYVVGGISSKVFTLKIFSYIYYQYLTIKIKLLSEQNILKYIMKNTIFKQKS